MRSMRFRFHRLAAAGWSLLCSLRCSMRRLHSLALSSSAWMDSTACDGDASGPARAHRLPHPRRGAASLDPRLGPHWLRLSPSAAAATFVHF